MCKSCKWALAIWFIVSLLVIATASQAESRVYVGMGITHFSNVDAGSPFNNDYEDNAEHTGVNIEYQYHLKRVYFYSSISIGKNKAKRDSNAGWNCTGCALPSELRIGVKWRVW